MLDARRARFRAALEGLALAALLVQPALAEPQRPSQRPQARPAEALRQGGTAGEARGVGQQTMVTPLPVCQVLASSGAGGRSTGDITIKAGQAVTLSWRCSFAASARFLPQGGLVQPTGAIDVQPAQTTTYSISATGAGGTRVFPIRVSVSSAGSSPTLRSPMPPSGRTQTSNVVLQQSASASRNALYSPCNLWVTTPGSSQYQSVVNIDPGQSAMLVWQCPQGISNVSISNYGPVSTPAGGKATVSPSGVSTQYQISSSGSSIAYSTRFNYAFVNVNQNGSQASPTPSCPTFEWDTGSTDYVIPIGAEGSPRTLRWACSNFTQNIQVSDDQGRFQSEPPTGSMKVCPSKTYTYQLIAPYSTIPEKTVTSTTQTPILRSANITFHTNDDDKDNDTKISATLADGQGNTLAVSNIPDNIGFPDNSDTGPYPISILYGTSVGWKAANSATLLISINPVGNDTWKFNFSLDMKFSDGSHMIYAAKNAVLSESGTQLSWALPQIFARGSGATPVVSSCMQ